MSQCSCVLFSLQCNIFTFTQVKYISVEFCKYIASLYLHILANFGQFALIFNKMVLIFLGVPIVFDVFSFKFHRCNVIANNEWSPIYPTSKIKDNHN